MRIYSCVGRTPSRRALLRNHRHCTRDSIYFVYSAEKCFHLRGNCQSDSRDGGSARWRRNGKRGEKEREREREEIERTKERREHCAPRLLAVTKALNSTMHPSKRTIASSLSLSLSVNNDSFDSRHSSYTLSFRYSTFNILPSPSRTSIIFVRRLFFSFSLLFSFSSSVAFGPSSSSGLKNDERSPRDILLARGRAFINVER